MLCAGTRLGPYEIAAPIGVGGMGEVYRARDTRLARDVAVKVLGGALSGTPAYRQRFEQEARATSALNHPNIVAVYDIGQTDGSIYVVSELLEGQTLRQRLSAGPIPHRTVVEYAVQVVRGLAAAHEKGIVHRDLKPENIFLTKDGGVKILDFGLAKVPAVRAAAGVATEISTQLMGTIPGIVMGTVGYMSPEQVRGYAVDARSDIFSFGVILYEALACERAFTGESAADTMSAILGSDPPEMPGTVTIGLHLIVRRCLEKNPDRRFQTAQDLGFALEAIAGVKSNPRQEAVPSEPWWRGKGAFAAIACFLVGVVSSATLLWITIPRREAVSVNRLTFSQITDDPGEELYPSFAPGDVVVYASNAEGNWDIYMRRLGELEAFNLTKDSQADDMQPSVSPDGNESPSGRSGTGAACSSWSARAGAFAGSPTLDITQAGHPTARKSCAQTRASPSRTTASLPSAAFRLSTWRQDAPEWFFRATGCNLDGRLTEIALHIGPSTAAGFATSGPCRRAEALPWL